MMKCANRPATILSDPHVLDREFRAARWAHHRFLDFEDAHQDVLHKASEDSSPGLIRVSRLVSWLKSRDVRASRTTSGNWAPKPRPALLEFLEAERKRCLVLRNESPVWKEALQWADSSDESAPPKPARRKRDKKTGELEPDEEFAKRCEGRRATRSRREVYHIETIYQNRRCYSDTYTMMKKAVAAAKSSVLKLRAQGRSARWRRPKFNDPVTISAYRQGYTIVEKGPLWWVIDMRIGTEGEFVRFKAKLGSWHPISDEDRLGLCQLTRRRRGNGWEYSVSLMVDSATQGEDVLATTGTVALDWGHREYGHDGDGLRVFTWAGDDGQRGFVELPMECRDLADQVADDTANLDNMYNHRDLPFKNRHIYRKHLSRLGALTEEQANWIRLETQYEKRINRKRRRLQNLRKETYIQAIRGLRKHYVNFGFEKISGTQMRKLNANGGSHRARQNRELSARYLFIQLCEGLGARKIVVTARNSTKECPGCGVLASKTSDILICCPGCGVVRDRDQGAALVLLKRTLGALANPTVSVENQKAA